MLSGPTEGHPEQFGGMVPMQRIGNPKEISDAVIWFFHHNQAMLQDIL